MEAAFLTPVLLFFLLGTFDGAFQFLDYLTSANALRQGDRTAAIVGSDGAADYTIVQAVVTSSRALRSGDLRKIVVYEASGSTSTVPSGCAAGIPSATAGSRCNVYTASSGAFTASASNTNFFGCIANISADRYFCPTTRKTALQGANGPPSWIGVYVEVTHTYLTKIFGNSITMTADGVVRLEAESLQ